MISSLPLLILMLARSALSSPVSAPSGLVLFSTLDSWASVAAIWTTNQQHSTPFIALCAPYIVINFFSFFQNTFLWWTWQENCLLNFGPVGVGMVVLQDNYTLSWLVIVALAWRMKSAVSVELATILCMLQFLSLKCQGGAWLSRHCSGRCGEWTQTDTQHCCSSSSGPAAQFLPASPDTARQGMHAIPYQSNKILLVTCISPAVTDAESGWRR